MALARSLQSLAGRRCDLVLILDSSLAAAWCDPLTVFLAEDGSPTCLEPRPSGPQSLAHSCFCSKTMQDLDFFHVRLLKLGFCQGDAAWMEPFKPVLTLDLTSRSSQGLAAHAFARHVLQAGQRCSESPAPSSSLLNVLNSRCNNCLWLVVLALPACGAGVSSRNSNLLHAYYIAGCWKLRRLPQFIWRPKISHQHFFQDMQEVILTEVLPLAERDAWIEAQFCCGLSCSVAFCHTVRACALIVYRIVRTARTMNQRHAKEYIH